MATTTNVSDALRSALRQAGIVLVLGTAVAALVGWLVQGMPGLWGALVGAATAGGFLLVTAVVMLATVNAPPSTTAAAVLGSWLFKMVLLFVLLMALRDQQFMSKAVFGIVAAVALVGVLAVETRAVLKAKVPYVDPGAGGGQGGSVERPEQP
ncbi:hypothetical protein [Streptoalloteichus tenebrarius]|uniref:hypothetical protein n=1 Tax=Streptoalloteichus tenebrarius (strain ATCC 17920 / DSM 40477 / JCM 4838 / CBS 697.72 / NBRC 16177 / NCIMB 11028 / NRRL B-12390 / A12253. 1 / ISP 5477) TaxID=1933 RepID=UPI0020A25A0E|nr:hypothetical protein [Streptoalloteichus tenebrarius]BFF03044.1 hypothetical protein GCM10020241_47190 [Streptoalloteichus tenebrarius]